MAATQRGIVTPEAVVLNFETAGIASRALARVLDALIQGAVLFAFLLVGSQVIPGSGGIVVVVIGVALVVLGYPILCEIAMRGRSPGKAALGLRVVTTEGAPIGPRHAFIRSALGVVDFLIPPGGLFAVLAAILSAQGQRLGDLVAGTIVLRERTASGPSVAVWFTPPPGLAGYAQSLDVSSVTDRQFSVVRSFLLRVQDLTPEARVALSFRLATPLAARMHHDLPPGVPPELFLVCVAAALQRRPVATPAAPSVVAGAPPPLSSSPPPPPPLSPPPPPPPSAPPVAPGRLVAEPSEPSGYAPPS